MTVLNILFFFAHITYTHIWRRALYPLCGLLESAAHTHTLTLQSCVHWTPFLCTVHTKLAHATATKSKTSQRKVSELDDSVKNSMSFTFLWFLVFYLVLILLSLQLVFSFAFSKGARVQQKDDCHRPIVVTLSHSFHLE